MKLTITIITYNYNILKKKKFNISCVGNGIYRGNGSKFTQSVFDEDKSKPNTILVVRLFLLNTSDTTEKIRNIFIKQNTLRSF